MNYDFSKINVDFDKLNGSEEYSNQNKLDEESFKK